jgi:hypothetical protein
VEFEKSQLKESSDSHPLCLFRSLPLALDIEREIVGQGQYMSSWQEPRKHQKAEMLVALPKPATAASLNKVNLKNNAQIPH